MKRFQKALLGVVVSGALLFSAQAAEPQDTENRILADAIPKLQQMRKETGNIETTQVGDYTFYVRLRNLFPEQNLYTITLSFINEDDSSYLGNGVINMQTGELIIPTEYDFIVPLASGKILLCSYGTLQIPDQWWYADETGKLTPIQLPEGYDFAAYHPDIDRFLLSKNVKKPVYDPYSGDGPATRTEDVTFFALADEDMNLLFDNIENAADPINGLLIVKTGSTKWERVDKSGADGNGTCGLFDPKTEKFVGKHDFNQIFWYDQHFIGTRSSGTKSYLLDGKGGETLLSANVKEYSSWAKTEVAAAEEHGLTESFSYPRLDITRENFTMLAMNLYNKIYPNKEIPALETKFTDCRDDPNVNNAAALGIVTGYEDGTFRPYKTISRQEAAAMLDRLYQVLGDKTDVVSEKAFADDVKIGDWARGSVYAMRQTGIMQGKENNQFCPTDGYTAEQSIVTIERMYQAIK